MGIKMRKSENTVDLLPDYGKKKLLTYAESFRDLAHTFTFLPEGAIANDTDEDVEDRQDYLMQKRLIVLCRRGL